MTQIHSTDSVRNPPVVAAARGHSAAPKALLQTTPETATLELEMSH